MPAFSPETSCMVAAVCTWHEHHGPARDEIERRLRRAETMVVAGPALVEAYAVLTRLPPPHRMDPADALALLQANFVRHARVVALAPNAYPRLLRDASASGIAGGQTYDAVIAACVMKIKGAVLLTFDQSHFLPFSGAGLEVVVLGRGA